MMTESIVWTSLKRNDITTIDEIVNQIHTTLPERHEVFLEKFELFPAGCLKLLCNGRMLGYGISHSWKLFSIPPLDTFLKQIPAGADSIYVHDVAVLPEARGRNAAGLYVAEMRKVARSINVHRLACVSVYGTDVLWNRHGFHVAELPDATSKLSTYGTSAKYMIAEVSA